jgi:hypothetical protein
MKLTKTLVLCAFALGSAARTHAAPSAEEVAQLGTTLTPWGAEVAGNKDGSIPPYTGGLTKPPACYKPGSNIMCDPFADEKPIATIDAKSLDPYGAKIPEGAKFMLKRWADYKISVYPTHRTAAFPKMFGDNAIKNATRAKLVNDGQGVEGAYGGPPFPLPKSGLEVVWNHELSYRPYSYEADTLVGIVDASGRYSMIHGNEGYYETPYYNPERSSLPDGVTTQKLIVRFTRPPREAGEQSMIFYSLNYVKQDMLAWSYTQGQRRVRLAPEFKYDTPVASYSGLYIYDEAYGYSGNPDRYDWKLVGKKDMLVPYNNYRFVSGFSEDNDTNAAIAGPQHIKPEAERWELHRVWQVEATLKAGKRHIYTKRVMYFDEDSWVLLWAEGYDASGGLYRVVFDAPFQLFDVPVFDAANQYEYDFVKGAYLLQSQVMRPRAQPRPPSYMTAENMGAAGIR